MPLSQKIPSGILIKILRAFRAHGDAVLLLALLSVFGYAALLFSKFIYPPLFTPQPPPQREAVFNREVYEKVLSRIQRREERLAGQLDAMPRDPFR